MKTTDEVLVSEKEFVSANILKAKITQNGYGGGDSGHGGFVELEFEDLSSTDMEATFSKGSQSEPTKITLTFRGDCERDTLIEALEFFVQELKDY